MRWRWAIGIAGFALAPLLAIAPAAADFRVCNKSVKTLQVAYGYNGGGRAGWITEGWRKIDSGGCATVLSGQLNNRYYYLYAEDSTGGRWEARGDEIAALFCISRERFKLFQSRYGSNNEADCAKHKLESKRFFRVDIGRYRDWTQTLHDDPAPAPPAAPPPPSGSTPPPSQPPKKGSACERFPNLC